MQKLNLTKKYARYPEYKDSGVEWVGEIPEGWGVEKIKHTVKSIDSGVWGDDPLENSDDIKCLRVADFNYEHMSFFEVETIRNNPSLPLKKILRKGDILIEKSGGGEKTPVGRAIVFNSDEKMVCANFIDIVRIHTSKVMPEFLTLFLSALYSGRINTKYIKQNTGIQNMGLKAYFEESLVLPSYVDQKKIVNYLDEKTVLIDQIIEKKKKQIELLREKRTAVINHAVTKGLDPKAELVESGIDWIGKIPKGWVVEKIKYVAPQRNLKTQGITVGQKYIGLENIESWTGVLIETEQEIDSESMLNVFVGGDVLFGKLRPYLAKVLAPSFSGVSTGELLDLVPNKKKILQKYLAYSLIRKDFIKLVDDSTYGSKMPRANWEFIGNQIVSFPPLDKQEVIIQYLDKQTTSLDKCGKVISESTELLQEFKTSLISNVVTGKIKI